MLWDLSTSNPSTVIRRCQIGTICRFQSPVTVEDCDACAVLLFYCDNLEGPMPSGSVIRNCRLWQGRGNATEALVVQGHREDVSSPPQRAAQLPLHDVLIENNQFHGGLTASFVESLVLKLNRFPEGYPGPVIGDCPAYRNDTFPPIN